MEREDLYDLIRFGRDVGLRMSVAPCGPALTEAAGAGALSDLYGRRRVILAATFVFASAPFLYLLVGAPGQLAAVRARDLSPAEFEYRGRELALAEPVSQELLDIEEAVFRRLNDERRTAGLAPFAPNGRLAALGRGLSPARLPDQVLVGDELVAVLLHHGAGELPAADDEHLLVVLLELLHQADEVAVAADDDEGVDVVVGERHLEGVEGEVDVGAVLVAAGRHVALHHAHGVLREHAAVVAGALPVAVGDLGDDLAALLDGLEDRADVEERGVRSRVDEEVEVALLGISTVKH